MSDNSPLKELYGRFESLGSDYPKAYKAWKKAAAKRIKEYAKTVQPVSRFIEKPKSNKGKDDVKGSFWTGFGRAKSMQILGVAPNIAFVKGYKAPFKKYHSTRKYLYYGDDNHYHEMRRSQTLTNDPGVENRKSVYYYGEKATRIWGFFGHKKYGKKLGYARVSVGSVISASPVYYGESFTDWMMHTGDKEIDRIVLEAGEDVLERFINKK